MRLCCWRSIDVGKPTSFLSRGLQESLAKNARESGVGLRSRPRIAKQSRKIRQMAGRACSYQTAVGFFIGPRRLFAVPHRLNWRKLLGSVFKLVRPDGSRAQAGPLARCLRASSPQRFPLANFCLCSWTEINNSMNKLQIRLPGAISRRGHIFFYAVLRYNIVVKL